MKIIQKCDLVEIRTTIPIFVESKREKRDEIL